MFNLGFLAEGLRGLGSFSGSGLGDLGHLGLGELGHLAAMTAMQRKQAAEDAKRKRQELAAAVAEARRTGGTKAAADVRKKAAEAKRADAQHTAAVKKEQHVADAAVKKKAQADKKAQRKIKKVAGKNISIDPKEEPAVDKVVAGLEAFKAAAQNALALGKSARTPAQRQAAVKAVAAAMAMVGSDLSAVVAQVGKQPVKQLQRSAKRLRGLGVYDPVTGIDDGLPDPNAYGPATNIDYQTGGLPVAGAMDPMQMMMMQQLMKPPELPKQCQKNMNKPICAIYTLSQQSQQQMGFLISIVMQMMQQLTQMMQQLMTNGPVADAGMYPPPQMDPSTGMMYPPPAGGMPSFDQSVGMPPPSFDPSAGMYAQAPTGGAYSPGGVEQIPAGFDTGGEIPGAGSADSFIPQDIAVSGGGYFTPPQQYLPTYAPGGDTYIQQEYNTPAEVVQMPAVPEAGYIPEQSADELIVDENQPVPQFQQAQLVLPQPAPQELVEVAAGGAMPGPTQAQIQDSYFDTEGGSEF